jgi:dCTP deaminase
MLSDVEILRRINEPSPRGIVITPLISSRQIGSASVDLRLGFHFKILRNVQAAALDPVGQDANQLARDVERYTHDVKLPCGEPFYLHPGQFALGTTLEYVSLPADVAASLDGRSSLGRLGITVHSTAGFIDPGFSGRITYEMQNEGSAPVALYPGMRVAQLCFFHLSPPACMPYGREKSKYKQQLTTTSSRWYEDPDVKMLRALKERDTNS